MLTGSPMQFFPSPDLITQYATFHLGRVKKLGDPERRNRVKVEVPGLLGKGKKNQTYWLEVGGINVGSCQGKGDEGIWWPLTVDSVVLVGFISGDPFALWAIPGPPVQDGKGENKSLIPLEAKKIGKKNARDATRLKIIKSEAGATLLMDDRGKKEKMMLVDWTGSGLFFVCPGKNEDEKEGEKDDSKPRKDRNRRATKLTANNTSEKPGKIMKDGVHISAFVDLNGSGWLNWSSDEQSLVAQWAKVGDKIKASVLCDAKNERVFITAGNQQIQVWGKENKIAVTRQIIQNAEKVDVESVIAEVLKQIGKEFKDYA